MFLSGYGVNGFSAGAFEGVNPFSPNPPDNPTGRAFPSILLGSILAIPPPLLAAPQPFSQIDWQNPRGTVRSIELRTHIQTRKTYYVDRFFGLGGKPNFDQPNPTGPRRGVSLIDQTSSGLALLTAAPPLPDNRPLKDWPNPRGAAFPAYLRGYTQAATVRFIGKDRFFGLGGKPNFDWPNPRGAVPAITLRTIAQNALTTGPFPTPFTQNDYPNPRRVVPGVSLKDFAPTQLPLTAKPFLQSDYQNPRAYPRAIDLVTGVSSGLALTGTLPQYPAQGSNYDWPVPKGPIFPIVLRTLANAHMPIVGWSQLSPAAGAGWGPVSGVNSPGWGPVSDSNSATWVLVSGVNLPGWGPVSDSNSVTWVLVNASTDAPTGFK